MKWTEGKKQKKCERTKTKFFFLFFLQDSREQEVVIEGIDITPKGTPNQKRAVEEGLKIFTIFDKEGREKFQKTGILAVDEKDQNEGKEEKKEEMKNEETKDEKHNS